jgi:NIPSNAP
MERQLRIYRLRPGTLDRFVDEWKTSVVPIRERFGFTVVGAWSAREDDRFAWILGYQGPEGFERRDAEYYDSAERAALAPDPARHIESMEAFLITSVLPEEDGLERASSPRRSRRSPRFSR